MIDIIGKHFQPSLMYESEARAYQRVWHFLVFLAPALLTNIISTNVICKSDRTFLQIVV
jgi:hypothetical protein